METEIEAKFLDIDSDLLRRKLKELGATLLYSERLMKRKVFDYPDQRLYGIKAWVRVRDEGEGDITLSFKQLKDRNLHGTKEITLNVDNFDKAVQFLESLGMQSKSYQETKREKWIYENAEITIDTWPWIPTFVEIEAPKEEDLKKIIEILGFKISEALHGSVETAYQKYFDVSEKEIDHWKEITFIPIPDWLEEKRRE